MSSPRMSSPRLPFPYRPEAQVVAASLAALQGRLDWPGVIAAARPWVQAVRDKGEWREKARAQLVEWFGACGDAEAVSRGRRYLGMYLN